MIQGRERSFISPEVATNLEVVGKRNRFMDVLRKTGELDRRRRPLQTALVRGLAWMLIAETQLSGQENLDIIAERLNKVRITGAANHSSDTDHPALEFVLMNGGYPEIAKRLVFPAGLKMWDRNTTRWGMWGMNTVPVAAPEYFEEADRMIALSLPEEYRESVARYRQDIGWLTMASLRALTPGWKTGEIIPLVYPETTRTRNGWINKGREETGVYFRKGLIVPFFIDGTGEIFPAEGRPDWVKIIKRQFKVRVAVGEPISGEELNSQQTLDWLKQMNATIVDFVMSRIVALKPERANPTLKPLYERLGVDIPAGLLIKATQGKYSPFPSTLSFRA